MSTTTSAATTPTKEAPISLTPNAIAKVKGIMAQQNPVPAGLRVGVVGGGCSGFSYSLQFDTSAGMMDKVFDMDGLKVFVDATSIMYLNGCRVDYVDTGGRRFQVREPERKEHLRLRVVVQRLIKLARKLRKPRRRTRLFLLLVLALFSFRWIFDIRGSSIVMHYKSGHHHDEGGHRHSPILASRNGTVFTGLGNHQEFRR